MFGMSVPQPLPAQGAAARDRFGNQIDPVVGYARGQILGPDAAFHVKIQRAHALIRERAAHGGEFHVLTGNRADFPLGAGDLGFACDGWLGPAIYGPELARLAREHLGAGDDADVALLNRTSAGVIAVIAALVPAGGVVASLVPRGRAHPCVRRGARLIGASVVEGPSLGAVADGLDGRQPDLAILTPVTSELDAFEDDALWQAVQECREQGIITLIDDAYGSRVRPILLDGPRTLELPVDLGITNSDKAALAGPRAGILVGRADLVARVRAYAVALGQEAREPTGLAVLRALERWTPELLLSDAGHGAALAQALTERLGSRLVRQTLLGPSISEEDVLALMLERAGLSTTAAPIVPVEATAVLGLLLLGEHGIVTVNALSEAGARPSIRLKPTLDAVPALGGAARLAEIVDEAITRASTMLRDVPTLTSTILGNATTS
jgi:L-seryl-tRNA(Ser) seleniumtransferase